MKSRTLRKASAFTSLLLCIFLWGTVRPVPAQMTTTTNEEPPIGQEKEETRTLSDEASADQAPGGQERIEGDIFGQEGGYIHPFLSITEMFSDNVYRTSDQTESGFSTIISPGVWIAVPRSREKILALNTRSYMPGGLVFDHEKNEFARRYQTYLLYRADIELNSAQEAENAVSHTGEGLIQYNFPGGLSIDLADQFLISHDSRGSGTSTVELDMFKSNLIDLVSTYDLSQKFKLRADYSNFDVQYDDSRNSFKDRMDNTLAGYLFYKYSPKTAFFTEYEYVDIKYDTDTIKDGAEHHVYGGMEWAMSAKSTGRIKAGYGIKEFDDPSIDGGRDFILELLAAHAFTTKTSITLRAMRGTTETRIDETDYVLTHSLGCTYLQRVTSKITASLDLSYTHDAYQGAMTVGDETKERTDDIYQISPALEYLFRKWLIGSAGYIFSERDSNLSFFDYVDNTFFVRLTVSL